MNINNINFSELKQGIFEAIPKYSIKTELELYKNLLDIKKVNKNRKNILEIFISISKMKNSLETLTGEINPWLNLIFGNKQNYIDKKKSLYLIIQVI